MNNIEVNMQYVYATLDKITFKLHYINDIILNLVLKNLENLAKVSIGSKNTKFLTKVLELQNSLSPLKNTINSRRSVSYCKYSH